EATVEYCHRIVAEPPQHPPESARERSVVLVVRNDLDTARNAETAQSVSKRGRIRQRMPAVFPTLGTRQVPIEMRVDRAANMSRLVRVLSPCHVVELEAAIDDGPVLVAEMERQRRCGDQSPKRHARTIASDPPTIVLDAASN